MPARPACHGRRWPAGAYLRRRPGLPPALQALVDSAAAVPRRRFAAVAGVGVGVLVLVVPVVVVLAAAGPPGVSLFGT